MRRPGLLEGIVAHNRTTPPVTVWPQVLAQVEDAYAEATRIAGR